MSALHRFDESLAIGEQASEDPWWATFYRNAFGARFRSMHRNEDLDLNRLGVDRVITLDNRAVTVDEKRRGRDYGDILLEWWSVIDGQVHEPGWTWKPQAADYVAYAIMPAHKGYLLDALTLRRVWYQSRDQWIALARGGRRGFAVKDVPNVRRNGSRYITRNIVVPLADFWRAYGTACVIHVPPCGGVR